MSIPYRHLEVRVFYFFSVYLHMSVYGYEHVSIGAFKNQLLDCRLELELWAVVNPPAWVPEIKSILSSQQEWYARLITEPFLHTQD